MSAGAYGITEVPAGTPRALTCGDPSCGKSWMEDITPAGRCPWEADHRDIEEPRDIAAPIIAEFRRFMIQAHIFCPVSGNVLDIRTARFILDPEGLPHLPLDPEVAAKIEEAIAAGEPALKDGYTLEAAR